MLLLQQVSLAELGDVLGHAQMGPVAILIGTVLLSLIVRTYRWQAFFLPDRRLRFGPLLGTLSISYMASTFLPFRAGEVVRAAFLGQRENVPVPRVVGTIVLEKLFDFLAIGVILIGLLVTTPLPAFAQVAGTSIAAVIVLGFGFVVALAVWRQPTLHLVSTVERRLPKRLAGGAISRGAAQFAEGTDSLRYLSIWIPILAWTVACWALSLASMWASGAAVGVPLTLAEVAFVTVVTSTGQAVPSSPGYVGVYHAAVVAALTAFGIAEAPALGVAVLGHAASYGTLVIAGLVALWLGGYGISDLLTGSRGAARPAPAERPVANAVASERSLTVEPVPSLSADR